MTTPDPSRAAFEKWRVQERRNRIPEFQKWPDDVLMVMLNCEPEREWKIWQAAMAHCISSIPADAITVNLVRHVGLDKHVARECEQIVRQLLLPAAPKQEGST